MDENSDEKLQQVTGQIFVGQGVLLAHKLGIFILLAQEPQTIRMIADNLELEERAIQSMVSCAGTLNLVEYSNGKYQLSPIGQRFLNPKSSSYYGDVFDLLVKKNRIMNFDTIEQSILSNSPQVDPSGDIFSDKDGVGSTKSFISALHQKAFSAAFQWVKVVNLSNYSHFIDIGGGSGIHTIAACLYNSKLKGLVCDRKPVLPYTKEYIDKFDLSSRINIMQLDMWNDYFPKGDVCFFGDIFHDWNREQCVFLARKCFESLTNGGIIVLHEMLFNEEKTGPFLTSAYNLKMMLWTQGQQYSFSEMESILQEAGFKEIQVKPSLGNWSVVIGKKA